MRNENKLSIIIISYNTRDMTLKCIQSILNETKEISYEIIVLDNSSEDKSYEAIAEKFNDQIKLIKSFNNLGFARANNQAVTKSRGRFILLLNPDTVILNGAIDRLLSFAEKYPNAGIWGGRTEFADSSLNPGSCWAKQTLWSLLSQALGLSSIFRRSNFFNPEGIGGWNRIGQREVDIVSGCFLLIDRKLWQQLDGFDPDFFMYGEDADLCIRAKSFGAKPIITSKANIIHYGGASEKIKADKLIKLLHAKKLLIVRHFHDSTINLGTIILAAWPLSRWFMHTILSFFGRKASNEKATTWQEVWKRRNEWIT